MNDVSIEGMTVNERLFHFGLFEPFDQAVRSRSHAAIVQILVQACFSQEQAEQTADAVLEAPQR